MLECLKTQTIGLVKSIGIVWHSLTIWTCCEAIRPRAAMIGFVLRSQSSAGRGGEREDTDAAGALRVLDRRYKELSPLFSEKSVRGQCRWSLAMGGLSVVMGTRLWLIIGRGTRWQQSNAALVMRLMMLC